MYPTRHLDELAEEMGANAPVDSVDKERRALLFTVGAGIGLAASSLLMNVARAIDLCCHTQKSRSER